MGRSRGRTGRKRVGFVLDNFIVMAWSFEDETDDYADNLLDKLAKTTAVVPALRPLEEANAMIMGELRKLSTVDETVRWTGILVEMPRVIDGEMSTHACTLTLNLACGHGLTAYDAADLALATRCSPPLATIDSKLLTTARAVGVAMCKGS